VRTLARVAFRPFLQLSPFDFRALSLAFQLSTFNFPSSTASRQSTRQRCHPDRSDPAFSCACSLRAGSRREGSWLKRAIFSRADGTNEAPRTSGFPLSTFDFQFSSSTASRQNTRRRVIPTEATRLFLARVLHAPGRVGRDPGKTRALLPGRWNQRSSANLRLPTFNFRLSILFFDGKQAKHSPTMSSRPKRPGFFYRVFSTRRVA